MQKNAQISIDEVLKRVEYRDEKDNSKKREQISIEFLIDRIEQSKILKEKGLEYIKTSKKEEWIKEVEESPINDYSGIDIECALAIMDAIQKGLTTKDAIYMSEHHFKIPVQRTRDLLYKYSEDGESFYKECSDLQRIAYNKERAALRAKKEKKLSLKM